MRRVPPTALETLLQTDPTVLMAAAAGLGLAIGLLLGWLIARARASADRARIAERDQRLAGLEGERDQARGEVAALRDQLAELRTQQARFTAQAEGERAAADEKIGLLRAAEQQLREAFASLSAEALRRNNQSFLELARASLGEFQKGASGDAAGS